MTTKKIVLIIGGVVVVLGLVVSLVVFLVNYRFF